MEKNISPKLLFTFDDVLIAPSRSSIEPREASVQTEIVKGIIVPTPLISAAMDRVTDATMAAEIFRSGGFGVVHRNCSIIEQVAMIKKVKRQGALVGAACGPFDVDRAIALKKAGVDILFIDCAHGHNLKVITSAKIIKKTLTTIPLVIGNIATVQAVKDLIGIADAVKVGVGPGSICTTRVVSGVGVPQLSAIIEVANEARKHGIKVVADGGMRTSGDIAKALAAGADSVMLGNMFAGTDEAPGTIVIKNGKKYKSYRGMGSQSVLDEKNSSDRYLVEGRKAIPEGVEGLVPCSGKVSDMIATLSSGVQVAMGYVGAKTMKEFQRKATFVRISDASMRESAPHSLIINQ